MSPRPLLALPLLALALLGAHCRSRDAAPAASPPPKAAPAADTAALPADGLTEAEAARVVPGIDTSGLTPPQRSALADFAADTFCPCAPMTLSGCLKTPPTCRAATRMAGLARGLLLAGDPAGHVLLRVESYFGSFAKERRLRIDPDGPSKGSPDARVTIVEFSDFQCPACRAAHKDLEKLVKERTDVRLVYRYFPLPQHPNAAAAAAASVYAAQKGRFWEFADQAFEHQENLDAAGLRAIATAVGLDPEAVAAAASDAAHKAKVDADRTAGEALNISGTPALYFNGRTYLLRNKLEDLVGTVEDELEWLSHGGAWTDGK